jgi:hypothetical protein
MIDVTPCPEPDVLLVLLYDDEGTPDERASLQDHVDRCSRCADVLTSLDSARGVLGAWHAPRLPLGFAFVRNARSPVRTVLWRGGLAAAAVLLLAAAASIARIDIAYDSQGFRLQTGVSRALDGETRQSSAGRPLQAVASAPAGAASTQNTWVRDAALGEPPWRPDLDLLSTQLRADLNRLLQESRQAAPMTMRVAMPAPSAGPVRTMTDAQLLERVQAMLDQSEIRQQSNLALRVTELGRQFELARQSDVVQMEQTLQRIEQQRGDLLRRVGSTQPRP